MQRTPEILMIPGLGKTEIIDTDVPRLEGDTKIVHSDGKARYPGGTIGIMMALKAAIPDMSVPDVVDLVLRWEQDATTPPLHILDSHTDLAASGEYENLYGLPAADVTEMIRDAINRTAAGTQKPRSPLSRFEADSSLVEPRPEGVLMVEGVLHTVVPTISGKPYVRVDTTRQEGVLEGVAYAANAKPGTVSVDALIESAVSQRNVTLGLVAGGLPLIPINLRNSHRDVGRLRKISAIRR